MLLTPKELEEIKKGLLLRKEKLLKAAKEQLQGEMGLDRNEMPDENDLATNEYLVSFELRLRGREKYLLRKIDKALDRIENGEYGVCEHCGDEIGKGRLKARPVTTMCIDCKEEQEKEEKNYSD
ncbi:MAG: RNA polymerase-binding protein DksA [Myxococcota bacterium]